MKNDKYGPFPNIIAVKMSSAEHHFPNGGIHKVNAQRKTLTNLYLVFITGR